MKKPSVLVIIPARGGSKRIKGKNIRRFAGEPLIFRTIKQAKEIPFADRIVVDTDSPKIAAIARTYGAEVPFLRPAHLAGDTSQMVDSVLHMVRSLAKDEYLPEYVLLLQPTSPLRELRDITAAWTRMQKGDVTSVVTVAPTHPQLYHLDKKGLLVLGNKRGSTSSNTQAWQPAFVLNGCFVYLVRKDALVRERKLLTKKTAAVICPRWRSVDLDTPEDWVMAELIHKHSRAIERDLKNFS